MAKYFVSYQYEKIFDAGVNHTVLETDKDLLTEEGIEEIKDFLKRKHKAAGVVILNIIQLRG